MRCLLRREHASALPDGSPQAHFAFMTPLAQGMTRTAQLDAVMAWWRL
jgi:hypothetical protein